MRPNKRFTRGDEPRTSAAPTTPVVRKGRYTNAPPQTAGDPARLEVEAEDIAVVVEPAVAEPVDKYASRASVGYGTAVGALEPHEPEGRSAPAQPPPSVFDEEPPPDWGAWTTVAARDGMRYQRHDSRL